MAAFNILQPRWVSASGSSRGLVYTPGHMTVEARPSQQAAEHTLHSRTNHLSPTFQTTLQPLSNSPLPLPRGSRLTNRRADLAGNHQERCGRGAQLDPRICCARDGGGSLRHMVDGRQIGEGGETMLEGDR